MNATPSRPSLPRVVHRRSDWPLVERPRAVITPRRTVRPASVIGTVLFGILLVLLLAWLGRYAMPPLGNLFQGGR